LLPEGLKADGFEVDYRPEITPAGVLAIIRDYEGLIVNSKVYVGKEMLDNAARLKFMCRAGSGLEVFDLNYARQKNVIAFNSPEGNRLAVAEFALGALLAMLRNIPKADNEVHKGEWKREQNRGFELSGKTVSFIAFGHTAQTFAKLLRGFDVKMLAYDKYLANYGNKYVMRADMEQIFAQTDILSLHLPLTAETGSSVNYRFLSSFSKPYWLLNTSRGQVLPAADLLKCLDEGKIKGAALDVLENEKLHTLNSEEKDLFEKMTASKKILLSPHIAGWTHESKQKIARVLLEKIRAISLA
jgi:D-3-phosphoglycerate dehydrogenase / 2-oxoglutarate reductase